MSHKVTEVCFLNDVGLNCVRMKNGYVDNLVMDNAPINNALSFRCGVWLFQSELKIQPLSLLKIVTVLPRSKILF